VVRSDTVWDSDLAKAQFSGTAWDALVQAGRTLAHNPKVAGSNPAPATNETAGQAPLLGVGPSAVRGRVYRVVYRLGFGQAGDLRFRGGVGR